MDNQNGDSGVNTILIVIILLVLVGAAVWWYTMLRTPNSINKPPNMTIDVELPTTKDMPSTGS